MLNKKLLCFLVAFFCFVLAETAFASHFRFGHTTWKRVSNNVDGSVTVQFDSTQAWRTSFLDILGINFGDGQSFYPSAADITDVITRTDVAGEEFTIRHFSVQHTYSASALSSNGRRFTVTQGSCCRIGSLINAGDASEQLVTIVDLNGTNSGSPVSTIPVIVQVAFGQINTLQIAAADPDGNTIQCRMATTSESSIPNVADFDLNPATTDDRLAVSSNCLLSWDLTAATVLDTGKKYAAQVVLEEVGRGHVVLDFIIEIVNGNPPSCASTVPVNNTAYAGVPFSASFTGTDSDPGEVLDFTVVGAPAGASISPASGTSQVAPLAATLNWTPTVADRNSVFALLVTFQDQAGLQGTCSVSIFVSPDDPDPLCVELDVQATQFSLDGNTHDLLALLKRTVGKFRRAGGKKQQARSVRVQGAAAQTAAWTAIWQLDSTQYSCQFTQSCVSVSNTSSLADFLGAVDTLSRLVKSTARKYKRLSGAKIKPILKKNAALVANTSTGVQSIPSVSYNCPVPGGTA